ncbi:MAG: hypothetical protein SW019_11480, partial [Actinomycetota bacterium]|nr:hypothetical protein [Actinomycetota bacterium]
MHVSARAVLTAGIAALTGGALAFTPSLLPGSMRTIEVLRPVTFTADSGLMAPVTDDDVRAALDLIGELGSLPGRGKITVRLGDEAATAFPANPARGISNQAPAAPVPSPGDPVPAAGQAAEITALEVLDDPVALNAASDLIDSVYSVTRYWANYVSLELGPWVLDWVPLGYLVSDQIYIWYPDFVLPVTDSFVYDFLDPVVNDPLNLQVWQQGVGDIVNTAVNGLYNGVTNEIQYILDFGWFPIPLPPIPPLPFAASTTETAFALTAAEADETATEDAEETGLVGLTRGGGLVGGLLGAGFLVDTG